MGENQHCTGRTLSHCGSCGWYSIMSNSCDSIAEDLMKCLSKSQCVKDGGSRKDCLQSDLLEEECRGLYSLYSACRRGQVDMRKRIRGNHFKMSAGSPISKQPEDNSQQ